MGFDRFLELGIYYIHSFNDMALKEIFFYYNISIGSYYTILILYVSDMLLIEKDIFILLKLKEVHDFAFYVGFETCL